VLPGVAFQTRFIRLLRGESLELPNLGYIPASVHVGFTGTVTAFAANPRSAVFQGKALVRIRREFVCYLRVARGTSFRPNKIGGADFGSFICGRGQSLFCERLTQYWFKNEESEKTKAQATKNKSHPLSPRERPDATALTEAKMVRIDQLG